MKKTLDKAIPLIHPTTICMVGTIIKEVPNFTTIGDIAVAGLNPALIMISIHENHACMEYINSYHTFSINIPTVEFLQEVDYAGIYSARVKDKSRLFNVGFVDNIPVIEDAPIQLIVEEERRVHVEHRVILVCRVITVRVDQSQIKSGKLDLGDIRPILYGLDNHYYSIGERIGVGYQEGEKQKIQFD